jgi:hypothetical protein
VAALEDGARGQDTEPELRRAAAAALGLVDLEGEGVERIEDARSVAAAVRSGNAPERPLWAEAPNVSTCKKCEYRNTCWELNEDESGKDEPRRVAVKRADGKRRKKVLGS